MKTSSLTQLDIMVAKQAAEFLGISYNRLMSWMYAGKVPHMRLGGIFLLRKGELIEFVHYNQNAVTPKDYQRIMKEAVQKEV